MRLFYNYLIPLMWLVFFIYWRIMAGSTKATQRLEPAASRILRALFFIGAIALFMIHSLPVRWFYLRFLPLSLLWFYIGAAVTLAGLLFAVWARVHIAGNWSSSVTVKQDHQLIMTGPYAAVRHPIYTGMLVGFLGSAIALGEYRGLLALFLVFWILWLKLRLEEKWMRSTFGNAWESYSKRTAALVPGIL
jgi:protein-S-isoprenylcysteine O-methyltransferase Ste14